MPPIVTSPRISSPFISAVIPVYNGENYLREAIDSVLNQTYTNYELLVIDDGSTDNTWEIIQSYGDKVRGYHKENGGVSSALNLAIDEMHGEWFAWLSHDDLWFPNKLERQVDWMNKYPDYQLYYTDYLFIENSEDRAAWNSCVSYPRGKALRKLFSRCYISGITTLISKECFQTIGKFDESYRCVQDVDMWIRIVSKYDVSLLPEPLAKSRVHNLQVGIVQRGKCAKEAKTMLLKALSELPLNAFYPNISNEKSGYLQHIALNIWARLWVIWKKWVVKYEIKSLLEIMAVLVSKLPKPMKKFIQSLY